MEENRSGSGPCPGLRMLGNLLRTAMMPVGRTLYVWGGGWNEADTGAGEEAVCIGVSPRWQAFFDTQGSDYDYKHTRASRRDGLDCSGYLGWVLYNTLECAPGRAGYVMPSTDMAQTLARRGWGSYTPPEEVGCWCPGDIMSMPGHVWLSLGTCGDGSVLLVHASPPGVSLCGAAGKGSNKAAELARACMSRCCPDWYRRYRQFEKGETYLKCSGQFRWRPGCLSDPEGMRFLAPEVLLERLAECIRAGKRGHANLHP